MWSWLFGVMQNRPFSEIIPFGLAGGILFGLFFGILMAFMMRRETQSVPFEDRSEFLQRLKAVISQIRYVPAAQSTAMLFFKPRFGAGVGAGIRVELRSDRAEIVGPKANLSKLVKLLEKSTGT
jgi:hypothetical protein